MALSDLKFEEADFVNQDISSLPNKVAGQAAFLKAKFDNIGKTLLALGRFNQLIDELINNMHPVGSIYITVNGANPGTYLPGTWVRWGMGRVIVGLDESDANFDTVEDMGGEKTHTLTQAELPVVDNGITVNGSEQLRISFDAGGTANTLKIAYTDTTANGSTPLKTASNGSGQAHNNLQPYVACYMWKRTA